MTTATKRKSYAGRKSKLTRKLLRKICDWIEKGAYDYIAAGACGVSRTTYYRWIQEGGSDTAPDLKREFRDEVEISRAKFRAKMEVKVAKVDPKFWLRNGPGKTRAKQPGWTDAIGEAPVDGETGETMPVTSDVVIMGKLDGVRERVQARRAAEEKAAAELEAAPAGSVASKHAKPKKRTPAKKTTPKPRPKPKRKR